jgi:hypothetical protein
MCRKSVYDDLEKKNVTLTKEEMEMMKRIVQNEFPNSEFDPYQVFSS